MTKSATTCVFHQCLLIDSRCQTVPADAKATWWMALASPQRKSIEVMDRDGLLKHLHMAGCLPVGTGGGVGGGAQREGLPTICVQRGAAKCQSLITAGLKETHNVSKLNI